MTDHAHVVGRDVERGSLRVVPAPHGPRAEPFAHGVSLDPDQQESPVAKGNRIRAPSTAAGTHPELEGTLDRLAAPFERDAEKRTRPVVASEAKVDLRRLAAARRERGTPGSGHATADSRGATAPSPARVWSSTQLDLLRAKRTTSPPSSARVSTPAGTYTWLATTFGGAVTRHTDASAVSVAAGFETRVVAAVIATGAAVNPAPAACPGPAHAPARNVNDRSPAPLIVWFFFMVSGGEPSHAV